MDLSKFFVKDTLIPVICQDERNGEVLMLGYANEEAFIPVPDRSFGIKGKLPAILSLSNGFFPTVMMIL